MFITKHSIYCSYGKITKVILAMLIITIMLLSSISVVYAETDSKKEVNKIDNKIENQNKDIKSKIKDFDMPNESEKFDSLLKQFEDKRTQEYSGKFNKEVFSSSIANEMFNLSLKGRKFTVITYMLFLMWDLFKISTIGSKNLVKRKLYINTIIISSFFLIIFLNIPLVMIYFHNNSDLKAFSSDALLSNMYGFIVFLKANSICIGAIFFVYGLMNKILGLNDLRKREFGSYMIKVAVIFVGVLQFLPRVMYLIL